MNKKLNGLVLIILLNILFNCICFKGYAQEYRIISLSANKYCLISKIYFGVENFVKISGGPNNYNNRIKIVSDSIIIRKINDSLYSFKPLSSGIYCTVNILDSVTQNKIDFIRIYCSGHPFIFTLVPRFNFHVNTYADIKKDIKKLYLDAQNRQCTDFTKRYEIESFKLTLKRNNNTIYSRYFQKNEIPKLEKERILALVTKGDILIAETITLKGKVDKVTVFNYSIVQF